MIKSLEYLFGSFIKLKKRIKYYNSNIDEKIIDISNANNFAEKYFISIKLSDYLSSLTISILEELGLPIGSYDDYRIDGYDSSIEIVSVYDDDFIFNEYQLNRLKELGFDICYLTYKSNKKQKFYDLRKLK